MYFRGDPQHLVLAHGDDQLLGAELHRWRDLEGFVGKHAPSVGHIFELARVSLIGRRKQQGLLYLKYIHMMATRILLVLFSGEV